MISSLILLIWFFKYFFIWSSKSFNPNKFLISSLNSLGSASASLSTSFCLIYTVFSITSGYTPKSDSISWLTIFGPLQSWMNLSSFFSFWLLVDVFNGWGVREAAFWNSLFCFVPTYLHYLKKFLKNSQEVDQLASMVC